MRFASFELNGRPVAALVDGNRGIPLLGIEELGAETPLSLLRDPPLDHSGSFALGEAVFRPVVPAPQRVICVGLNYHDHLVETGRDTPEYPVLFTKFASTLTGPFADIPCPPESDLVDYEGELAVVIGERGRRLTRADAPRIIAGYAAANDVSMRDFQSRTHQWLQGKAWDATTPVGPYLALADTIADPSALTLRTTLNGETVQEASTGLLMFDIPTLVSTISQFTELVPGDLILTGTPGGVGFKREPPVRLLEGDVVAVEVEGVGRIENRCVAERV